MIQEQLKITEKEFSRFQRFIFDKAGVTLPDGKRSLVASRLMKRLRHYGLNSFGDYYSLIDDNENENERQITIDLLTTHETYFFREDAHFSFLRDTIKSSYRNRPVRIWSAACSTGQEPYSIAMILSDLGREDSSWDILASDISQSSLATAQRAVYTNRQMETLPQEYLARYCLKGVRTQEGHYTVNKQLRRKVNFKQINLNGNLTSTGRFDFIFLRNVMIYFDTPTKQRVVRNLIKQLNRGGYLIIGHSETLNALTSDIKNIRPSIYALE